MATSPAFQTGDRVMTYNAKSGTVSDVIFEDDGSKILLIKIDNMPGEYAYDMMEVIPADGGAKYKAYKTDPLSDIKMKKRYYA
ncbi:hypothetical protein GJ688_00260 [Heliobacillus mobilis]|uniref:Uncharacterized protein n=3 Tax=Heliobacterium TaxID=2697 RepID=A0A6I3SAX3_HELMO|nr:hypothetical protein [Heliobacterium mobile]